MYFFVKSALRVNLFKESTTIHFWHKKSTIGFFTRKNEEVCKQTNILHAIKTGLWPCFVENLFNHRIFLGFSLFSCSLFFSLYLYGSVHVVGGEGGHEGGGEDGALVVAVHSEPAGHVGAEVAAETDAEAVVVRQEGPFLYIFLNLF